MDEDIETLQHLGLSVNEAKIYLTLANLKIATAKALSNASGLASCDVYRTLQGLFQLGLVDILVSQPREFKATPPEEAFALLLNRNEEKIGTLREKSNRILSKMKSKTVLPTLTDSRMFIVPYGGDRLTQIGTPLLLETKRTLDCVQTNALFHNFVSDQSDTIEILLKKKIQLRFVVEDSKALKNPSEALKKLLKYNNFKVRFANSEIPACILLSDENGAFLGSSPKFVHSQSPSYMSSNFCFVKVIQCYFEARWQKAKEN